MSKTLRCNIGPNSGECDLCQEHPGIVLMTHIKEFRHDDETHIIPLGAVVECNYNVDDGFGADDIHKEGEKELCIGIIGRIRMYVVGLTRDCDGTPLYILGSKPVAYPDEEKMFSPRFNLYHTIVRQCHTGMSGSGMKVVGQAQLKTLDEFFGV